MMPGFPQRPCEEENPADRVVIPANTFCFSGFGTGELVSKEGVNFCKFFVNDESEDQPAMLTSVVIS